MRIIIERQIIKFINYLLLMNYAYILYMQINIANNDEEAFLH